MHVATANELEPDCVRLEAIFPRSPAFALSIRRKEYRMLDIVMLALGLVFFVATIAYAYACDRL
jgi:hypothetical protein